MSDTGNANDEVVNEFDQTNGMVSGLDGDDGGEVDTDDGTDLINGAADRLVNGADFDGSSDEDRDPAVTSYSEDDAR